MELQATIAHLLSTQRLAVLASYGDRQPYTSLVAFAASEDLSAIYFATSRSTRKFTNLIQCIRVALLVDSRSNDLQDFLKGTAVTALGTVREIEKGEATELYLHKHPNLHEFFESSSTAFLEIAVERYLVVSNFQDVQQLQIAAIHPHG